MSFIASLGYKIEIGEKALRSLNAFLKGKKYSKHFILCDENTLSNCLPTLISHNPVLKEAEIFEVESGESSKDLQVCSQLWQSLLDNNADKNSVLINLGGGVISDLGGFVASVYKRGIDFVNVPTSLLAMADASVGGKTGIDFGGEKNMVGTITQPKGVFIYPVFLNTLPKRHYKNGKAEIFKTALVSDKTLWKKLSLKKIPDIEQLIVQSVGLKNKIVKKDPHEKNIRKALNFGHTIGHAVESFALETQSGLLHGEAVVIGMIAEAHLSYLHRLVTKKQLSEICSVLQKYFEPSALLRSSFDEILKHMLHDKKNSGNQILCSLVQGIGKCRIRVAVTPLQIKQSLEFYNSLFK